jgi:hypothetical protein
MFRLLAFSIFISACSFAQDDGFMVFGEKGYLQQKKKESKFILEMGANYLSYPTALPSFDGKHESFKQDQDVMIWGTDITWGYEQHLFGDFSTTIRFGGFYNKTLNETKGKAAEDIALDVASITSEYEIYGAQASLSLNYLVDNSFLAFQPFAEFGLGKGFAIIDEEYEFDGAAPDPAEVYDVRIKEDFTTARISIGVNFISSRGLYSYFKASQTSLLFGERDIQADIAVGGSSTANGVDTVEKDQSATATSYAIGLGALF